MARTSSRNAPAVAGRVADAGPRLGLPLFPNEQPLADDDRGDGAAGSGAVDQDHQRASTQRLFEADSGDVAPQATFDGARRDWPGIGIALYALDPGGVVTLEVHSEGEVYRFDALTADEALALAFPAQPSDSTADVFG